MLSFLLGTIVTCMTALVDLQRESTAKFVQKGTQLRQQQQQLAQILLHKQKSMSLALVSSFSLSEFKNSDSDYIAGCGASSDKTCSYCESGYLGGTSDESLNQIACFPNCGLGKYLNIEFDPTYFLGQITSTTCGACYNYGESDGCLRCIGPGAEECLECSKGYYLDRGATNTQLHGSCIEKEDEEGDQDFYLQAAQNSGSKAGTEDDPFDQIMDAIDGIYSAAAPYTSFKATLHVKREEHDILPYV